MTSKKRHTNSERFVQNKYNIGDVVHAKAHPTIDLVINLSLEQVYFCKVQKNPEKKELVYFERELAKNLDLEAKNTKGQAWENEGGFIKN